MLLNLDCALHGSADGDLLQDQVHPRAIFQLLGRHRYLTAVFFFCPRLRTESRPFAAFRPGFFCHSIGSSSPSIGGLPLPARSRIRRVSARSARRPLSRKYSSVRKAETFSATATLMSWLTATPSSSNPRPAGADRSSPGSSAPPPKPESAAGPGPPSHGSPATDDPAAPAAPTSHN
jgi:hypothetical protein